jgi:two-component system chemotaxis response regulator CheY
MVQPNHADGHRLLAVEDDADCSDLIMRTATKCGYAATSAADVTEMVAAIERWQPHVITLDLCLPEVDAIEVVSAIKATGFTGPVIIVSGQPEWIRDFTSKAAAECGLSVPAHLSKPVDFRRLRELLTGILGSLRALTAAKAH